jgi:hypothetical protein
MFVPVRIGMRPVIVSTVFVAETYVSVTQKLKSVPLVRDGASSSPFGTETVRSKFRPPGLKLTAVTLARSGAAEAVKAPKARAHVEMTSAIVWRVRSAREQIQFLVLPFELFMV